MPTMDELDAAGHRRPRNPPTILDVAARAGRSKSVVSRVLRGEVAVSESSRQAILAAAAELGYRPNAVARSLVQRRTYNVGVVVSDLHNLFFAEVLDGVAAIAEANRYQVLIVTADRDPDAESRAVEALLQLRVDALILAGTRLRPDAVARLPGHVPVAVVGDPRHVTGVDVVVNDDVKGAGLVVQHLVELGHRRIAMVDGGDGAGAAERRAGYEAAMRRRGLGAMIRVERGDFTEDAGFAGARRLLARSPVPTAIFAANDLAAVGALSAIQAAGFRVPGDLSLVGYDNMALAGLRQISLTSVHQARREIGEAAMRGLLGRLARPSARPRRSVLPPRLIIRRTTSSARP